MRLERLRRRVLRVAMSSMSHHQNHAPTAAAHPPLLVECGAGQVRMPALGVCGGALERTGAQKLRARRARSPRVLHARDEGWWACVGARAWWCGCACANEWVERAGSRERSVAASARGAEGGECGCAEGACARHAQGARGGPEAGCAGRRAKTSPPWMVEEKEGRAGLGGRRSRAKRAASLQALTRRRGRGGAQGRRRRPRRARRAALRRRRRLWRASSARLPP